MVRIIGLEYVDSQGKLVTIQDPELLNTAARVWGRSLTITIFSLFAFI